jgi:hypothetical protein
MTFQKNTTTSETFLKGKTRSSQVQEEPNSFCFLKKQKAHI